MPRKAAPRKSRLRSKVARKGGADSTIGPTALHRRLKLSHHRHSGQLLPARHTSHGVLLIIMLLVGIFAFIVVRAYTANAYTITGEGSVNFQGVVKPTQAAQIVQPKNKQLFSSRSITIAGTCPTEPPGNVVKIIDNGINIGTAACNNGQFQLNADLFNLGINYMRAIVSNSYSQDGPESVVIGVYYRPAGSPGTPGTNYALFNVSFSSSQYAVAANTEYDITVKINSGTAPFALNIDWGDGSNNLLSKSNSSDTMISHKYRSSGEYQISVNAVDYSGQKAYSQTAVLVSGQMAATISTGKFAGSTYGSSMLTTLLKVYAVLTAAVFAFWLGERYEYRHIISGPKLRRAHR